MDFVQSVLTSRSERASSRVDTARSSSAARSTRGPATLPSAAATAASTAATRHFAAQQGSHGERGLAIARGERGLAYFVLDVESDRGEEVRDAKQLPRYAGFQRGQQCLEKLRPRVRSSDLRSHTGNTSAFLGSNVGMIRHSTREPPPVSMMQSAYLSAHEQRKGCRRAVRGGARTTRRAATYRTTGSSRSTWTSRFASTSTYPPPGTGRCSCFTLVVWAVRTGVGLCPLALSCLSQPGLPSSLKGAAGMMTTRANEPARGQPIGLDLTNLTI